MENIPDQNRIERQPESVRLSFDEDKNWLSALADRQITKVDIAEMNDLISLDSDDMLSEADFGKRCDSLRAREIFFGQMLGWDDDKHPLASAYERLKAKASYDNSTATNTYLMPLSTVVNTERFMSNAGIDVSNAVRKFPNVLCFMADTIEDKINTLNELGLDAVKIINARPNTMSLATQSVRSKIHLMDSLLGALGSEYTGKDIVEIFPSSLELSKSKLLATTRFVAEHGDKSKLEDSPKTIRKMLISPLDSHLAAIASEEEYSAKKVGAMNKKRNNGERREHSLGLLSDEKMRQHIGEKSIKAYLKNVPLKAVERERYPDIAE